MSAFLTGLQPRQRRLPFLPTYWALIIYVVALSIYGALTVPDTGLAEIVFSIVQRPPLRMYTRTVFWVLQTLMVFIGLKAFAKPSDFGRLLLIFLYSALVALCVALIQSVAFRFLPSLSRALTFFSSGEFGDLSRTNLFSFRPCPFVREPRYFGVAMGTMLAILILIRAFPIADIPKLLYSKLLLGIVSLLVLMTAAVSAIGGVALGIVFLGVWLYAELRSPLLARRFLRQSSSRSSGSNSLSRGSLVASFFVLASVIVIVLVTSASSLFVDRLNLYLERSGFGAVDELSSQGVTSDSGTMTWNAYVRWLRDEPVYLLIGAGLGSGSYRAFAYMSFLPGLRYDGTALSARLPALDTLGDIGVIGIALMFSLLYSWWRTLGDLARQLPGARGAPVNICRGLAVFFLGCWPMLQTLPLIWLFLGLGVAYIHAMARKQPGITEFLPVTGSLPVEGKYHRRRLRGYRPYPRREGLES